MANKDRQKVQPKFKGDYKKLFTLFGLMLKLGAFTFGGGYAMFPLLEREYVENRDWFSTKEMLDILAVSQSLPGMVSINSSILIGYRLFGFIGTIVAVVGLTLPSLIVLSVLSVFYVKFKDNVYVKTALKGIRVAVIALLVQAVIKLGKPGIKGVFGWIMASAAFLVAIIFSIHPIIIILAGLFIGIIYTEILGRKAADKK